MWKNHRKYFHVVLKFDWSWEIFKRNGKELVNDLTKKNDEIKNLTKLN